MTNPTAPEPSREAIELAAACPSPVHRGDCAVWDMRGVSGENVNHRFISKCTCDSAILKHAIAIDAALQSARDEAYEKCLAAAAEQERCERGFKQLAHEAGDMQRMSDFEEGESVAKTIGDAIRALKGRSA